MAVTPELIKRYLLNTCTPAERELVQQWFSVEAGQADDVFPGTETEDDVKAEMWDNIQWAATKGKRRKSRIVRFGLYPLAACLLLAVGLLVRSDSRLLNKTIMVDNSSGLVAKRVHFADMDFVVEPNSKCTIEVPYFGKSGSVRFCGAVAVMNTSANNRKLDFNTGVFNCKTVGNDNVNLHKGQTYLVMTDDNYSIISATTDEMTDGIPRVFSSRLKHRFNL